MHPDILLINPKIEFSTKDIFRSLKVRSNFKAKTSGTVSLFNNLVIRPILFFNLYYDYYFFTMCLVWVRAYFDGLDGYIARKYEKCSKECTELYEKSDFREKNYTHD